MTQQYYQLKLTEAIELYKHGLLSTSGLLYFFLKIRLAPGWKMTLHQREISQKLGISKSQFYRAINKLSASGLINWESPNGLVVTLEVSNDECNLVTDSATQLRQSQRNNDKCNSVTDNATQVTINATEVTDGATEVTTSATPTAPKASSSKGSSGSPYSYQIFIKSLSDVAREKFLNFVKEKIKDFPKPINDVQAWLAGLNQAGQYRWQVYYTMFQNEVGEAIAPSQDWENHPRWSQAIAAMRTGVPRFIVLGQPGCEDIEKSTRQAMAEYAEANNLVWGDK